MSEMARLITVLSLLAIAGPVSAQDWQIVWSDEFESDGLPDSTKWNYDIGGHGWGNLELQFYTDRSENARVENGVLVIEAREEEYEGNSFTSARLVTRERASWQYGRIEARIKLPFGQGLWPAFWMLPTDSPYGGWPTGGEIDIMEYLGHDTDRAYGTLHYGGGELGHRFTGTHYDLASGSFAEEFHTFAIDWEPRRMRWYVDGELYQTQISWSSAGGPYPAPFDHPFHILLNVAVGGEWPGYPDETTTFPQRMEVDYVRVYQDADAYPQVQLDNPIDGASVEAGSTLSLVASASDSGAVEAVEFLQQGGILGTVDEPPYSFEVEHVADGCYSLSARAIDDAGYAAESEPADVVVGAGCPDGSRWPFLMVRSTIPGQVEAEFYDLGGAGVAFSDFSPVNEGNGIRQDEGVDLRRSKDNGGGFDISNIIAREWVTYSVDVAETGRYRVVARVASRIGGTMRLSVDDEDLLGDVSIDPSGGDTRYGNTVLGEVELSEGAHTLRLDMRSAGFSLNRLQFTFLEPTSAGHEAPVNEFELQHSPNPAADRAEVTYRLNTATAVEMSVVDMLGRQVTRLHSGRSLPGVYRSEIDVASLASGVYLLVLRTVSGVETRPLTIVR